MHTVVIGAEAVGLEAAISTTLPRLEHRSVLEALRRPGLVSGADLVIFPWWPGGNLTLEEQAFAASVGCLHVEARSDSAAIGPYVAPHVSPCPQCHAAQMFAPPDVPSRPLVGWVVAWLALELAALEAHGATDLVGRSYIWEMSHPGLQDVRWERLPGCRRPGCVSGPR